MRSGGKHIFLWVFLAFPTLLLACDEPEVDLLARSNARPEYPNLQIFTLEFHNELTDSTFSITREERMEQQFPANVVFEDTVIFERFDFYELSVKLGSADEGDANEVILSRGKEHQLLYAGNAIDDKLLDQETIDLDPDGLPIGLQATLIAINEGMGKLELTLHYVPLLESGQSGKKAENILQLETILTAEVMIMVQDN